MSLFLNNEKNNVMEEIDKKIQELENKRYRLQFDSNELDLKIRITNTKIILLGDFIDELKGLKIKLYKDEKIS